MQSLWPWDDPFGDRARVAGIVCVSIVVLGLVKALGFDKVGQGLSPKQGGLVLVCVGGVLLAVGLGFATAYPKGLGGPMLPVWLGGLCLLAVGLIRLRGKKD